MCEKEFVFMRAFKKLSEQELKKLLGKVIKKMALNKKNKKERSNI